MVVEVIQSDLAPCYDLGSLCQSFHFFEIGVAGKLSFVGMNADRCINKSVFFGELNGAVQRTWAGSAANGENGFDPSFACACQHLFTVGIELLHLEMGVGVDEG